MSKDGMTLTYDGKKNTILCSGIVKEYPIGGMICEYARLHPRELKKIFDSYPERGAVYSTDNLTKAVEWLQDEMLKNNDTVTALMILTECLSGIGDLLHATPEEFKQHLEEVNREDETKPIKDYILEGTGYNKFCVDTIGGVLSYCYYVAYLHYVIFKHTFNALMKSSRKESGEDIELENEEKTLEAFGTFYGPENLQFQQIDFKIVAMEGKMVSLYTIQSSLSLLLFEVAHLIEERIQFKQCKNCGNYFIPTGRNDSIYCGYPSPQNPDKSCKVIGAQAAMAEKMKNDEATHLYRKIYMRNKMLQKRHPEDPRYSAVLKKLVQGAKRWRKKIKDGVANQAEYLEWVKTFDRRTTI